MTGRRALHSTLLMFAAVASLPQRAEACTCVSGWPTFEEAAAEADVVVIGVAVGQAQPVAGTAYGEHTVAFIDVTSLHPVKPKYKPVRLRVWDGGFGSSCSTDLRPFVPGTLIALALHRSKPEYREYQELVKISVGPGDYLLRSCGEYFRRFKTSEEAAHFAARLRKLLSEPSR